MEKPLDPAELTFRICLMAMPGPRRRPKVRMLWISIAGGVVVYEGLGSWTTCVYRVKRLRHADISGREWVRVKKLFERDRYVVLDGVRASLHSLESLGLQRADR
jgi:hypothetical protein